MKYTMHKTNLASKDPFQMTFQVQNNAGAWNDKDVYLELANIPGSVTPKQMSRLQEMLEFTLDSAIRILLGTTDAS